MTKEIRNPKFESVVQSANLEVQTVFVIRHWSFVILRHEHA